MIVEKTNFTYLATMIVHSLPGPNTNMEKWKDWNSYPCIVDLSDCAAETPEGNDRFSAVQLCKLTRFVQRKELIHWLRGEERRSLVDANFHSSHPSSSKFSHPGCASTITPFLLGSPKSLNQMSVCNPFDSSVGCAFPLKKDQ